MDIIEESEPTYYRICLIHVDGMMEIKYPQMWTNGQVNQGLPEMKGTVSFVSKIIQDYLVSHHLDLNTTVEVTSKVTGCYDSIRDNRTDFAVSLQTFPIQDYESVLPFQVLLESGLQILSPYTLRDLDHITYTDFFTTSLKSFSKSLWIMIWFVFSVFCFLLWIRKKVDPRRKYEPRSVVFETLCHLAGCETTDFNNKSGRLISFTMTIGFFFVFAYYLNLMSTEMVVQEKPETLNSYQDMMNRENMTPHFIDGFTDIDVFSDEVHETSIQYKFWQKFKDKAKLVDLTMNPISSVALIQSAIEKQDAAFIVTSLFIGGGQKMLCKIKVAVYPMFKNVYSWLATDPHQKRQTSGAIMRQAIRSTRFGRIAREGMLTVFESGLLLYTLKLIVDNFNLAGISDDLPPSELPQEEQHHQMQMCLSTSVNYHAVIIDKAVVENFRLLIIVCICLVATSFLALMREFYADFLRNARRKRKKKVKIIIRRPLPLSL